MNTNDIKDDEKNILLKHDYDGIQELDHPLPYWWLVTFFVTIIFGIPYFILFVWGGGGTLFEEFLKDKTRLLELKEKIAKESGGFETKAYKKYDNKEGIKAGILVYEENCLSCHEEGGKGDIGPNLTDAYWMHAKGTPETIYKVVYNGVEEKGMPIWSEVLSKEEIYQVTAYLMKIKDTNVKGKDPQGERFE